MQTTKTLDPKIKHSHKGYSNAHAYLDLDQTYYA